MRNASLRLTALLALVFLVAGCQAGASPTATAAPAGEAEMTIALKGDFHFWDEPMGHAIAAAPLGQP